MVLISGKTELRRSLMNRDYAEMTANLTLNRHFRKASAISLPLEWLVVRRFESNSGLAGRRNIHRLRLWSTPRCPTTQPLSISNLSGIARLRGNKLAIHCVFLSACTRNRRRISDLGSTRFRTRKVSWNARILIAIAVLAWSRIGAGGSASGVTVQGIAAMFSWLTCQKRLDQEQSASTYFERLFFATDWESTEEVAASGHPHKAR
jgi:hypothetical protein